MTYSTTFALVALAAAGVATAADAAPYSVPVPGPTMRTTLVRNGYGPLADGIYGNRRRSRTSHGIGYRGRGTRTGGPAGGLPGRS